MVKSTRHRRLGRMLIAALIGLTFVAIGAPAHAAVNFEVTTSGHTGLFDRTYDWDVAKSVDAESKNAVDGAAEFDYVVEAIPGGFTDSQWRATGQIAVTNTGDEAARATIIHSASGAVCSVPYGTQGNFFAPGETKTYTYSCEFPGGSTDGTLSRTDVTWEGGRANVVAPLEFNPRDVDRQVQVLDDQAGPAGDAVTLGTATWNAEGTPAVFPYTLSHDGVAGECVDHTNTAWLEVSAGDDPTDSQTVEVCAPRVGPVLEVTTSDDVAEFERTYHWDVAKSVDAESRTAVDGAAEFDYVVEAIPTGFTDSDWVATGEIVVTNTGDEAATPSIITSTRGAVCSVSYGPGGNSLVAAGTSRSFPYECTFFVYPGPFVDTRTIATWGNDERAEVYTIATFDVGDEVDRQVQVLDDQAGPAEDAVTLGTATWNSEGTPAAFPYSLSHDGVAGECVDHTNTAWLEVVSDGDEPTDSQTVEVCTPAPAPDVSVDVTAEASFDRTYLWDVDKSVDADSKTAVDGAAEFDHTVRAIPAGSSDSGWQLTGTVDVVNSGDAPAVVDVTQVVDVGGEGSCEVVGGEDLTVAAGTTVSLDYSCSFASRPDYQGMSTATVTWDGDSATGSAPVAFELDEEIDRQVQVVDDQAGPVEDAVVLGTATWNAEGTPAVFSYSSSHAGVAGQCVEYTSTAWLDVSAGDDPTASRTVEVCMGLVVAGSALPDTGAGVDDLLPVAAALLLTAGVLVLSTRRRA